MQRFGGSFPASALSYCRFVCSSGTPIWAGDTTRRGLMIPGSDQQNTLGVVTFVISLGRYGLCAHCSAQRQPNRGRRLLAQGTLLLSVWHS